MRRKRQDAAKRLVTTLVVVGVIVAFSFQNSLSGQQASRLDQALKLARQAKKEFESLEKKAKVRQWKEDHDGDGKPDHHFFDIDGDGKPEFCFVDMDEDGIPEEYWYDPDDDGDWDVMFEDKDEDGKDDKGKIDHDKDGKFEWIWKDKNGNGKIEIDELERLKPPEPVNGPKPRPGKKKAFKFGFEFGGGWSSWTLGDFGLSKEYFENLNSIPGYSASTSDLSGSPFGGFDLILAYNFPKNHSIGLSAGLQYFPGGMFEQKWTYQDTTSTSKLDLSAFSIPVELFYKHPVGKGFFLRLAGGVDFYHATIDYDSSFSMFGEDYFYKGKLKDKKIGSHVSLGVEYSLNKNLALSVNAGYSFAKLNNFTGTLVDRDGAGTDMLLTMARDEFGEMLSIHPLSEPIPPDYRPAEIDLSGFKFSMGLRIFLQKGKESTIHYVPELLNLKLQDGTDANDFQEGEKDNNNYQRGGPGDDDLYGGDEKDTQNGGGGNDHIYPGKGNGDVDGGDGTDTVYLEGKKGDWVKTEDGSGYRNIYSQNTITIKNVENIKFTIK